MQIMSLQFALFVGIMFLVYVHLPLRARYIWLFIGSIGFYYLLGKWYLIAALTIAIFTYLAGRILSREGSITHKKCVVAICSCFIGAALLFYRFNNFFLDTLGIENDFVLLVAIPVGMSFYSLQALGYVIDVYRGKIESEKNPIRYVLFVSYFPQILAGPITRSYELIPRIKNIHHLNIEEFQKGIIRILYGLFLKMVIADRLSLIVSEVYSNYEQMRGMQIVLATVLFGIQIYCDFCGYSSIARGVSLLFGIELRENFKTPYLANSIKEFWRGWHISLTSWFTEYIYIPLGGSRKGWIRTGINTFIVFLISGIWHGSGMKFIVWGALNGLFLIVENWLSPHVTKLSDKLSVNRSSSLWKGLRCCITFVLIDYAWLFFNANSLNDAIVMTIKMFTQFRPLWFLSENCFNTFGNAYQLGIIMVGLVLLWRIELLIKRQNKPIEEIILSKQIVWRWVIYCALILLIVCCGLYGINHGQTEFIYSQF